jgi:hypothetical protein
VVDSDLVSQRANPSLARLATKVGDQTVYLVPTADGVCSASTTYLASSCVRTQDLTANGAVHFETIKCSPYLSADQIEIDGIVPDGVSDLKLTEPDRSAQAIPVSGSTFVVYLSRAAGLPAGLSWNYGGQAYDLPLPVGGSNPGAATCSPTDPQTAISEQRAAVTAAAKAGWRFPAAGRAARAARAATARSHGQ